MGSLRRITENIEEELKPKDRKTTESDSEGEDGEEEEGRKRNARKGKNSKIPL